MLVGHRRYWVASSLLGLLAGACAGDQTVADRGECDVLIECAAALAPAARDEYEAVYGPAGTCWDGSPDTWADCRAFCSMTLDALDTTAMLMGKTCGACSTDTDCGEFGADAFCDDDGFCALGSGDETTGDGDDTTDDETTGDGELSHALDIQPIWDANCTSGCHEPGGVSASVLVLSTDAHAAIVGAPSSQATNSNLVEPSDSAASYLVAKLRGTHTELGGVGLQMPASGSPLPEATISTIEAWIDAGAAP